MSSAQPGSRDYAAAAARTTSPDRTASDGDSQQQQQQQQQQQSRLAAAPQPTPQPSPPRRQPGLHDAAAQTDIRLGEWLLKDSSVSRGAYVELQTTLRNERVVFLREVALLRQALARSEAERNLAASRTNKGAFQPAASGVRLAASASAPGENGTAGGSSSTGGGAAVNLAASVSAQQCQQEQRAASVALAANSAMMQMNDTARVLGTVAAMEEAAERHCADLTALRVKMSEEMDEQRKAQRTQLADVTSELHLLRVEAAAAARAAALERERVVFAMERGAWESVHTLKHQMKHVSGELEAQARAAAGLREQNDELRRELHQLRAERIMMANADATHGGKRGGGGGGALVALQHSQQHHGAASALMIALPLPPSSSAPAASQLSVTARGWADGAARQQVAARQALTARRPQQFASGGAGGDVGGGDNNNDDASAALSMSSSCFSKQLQLLTVPNRGGDGGASAEAATQRRPSLPRGAPLVLARRPRVSITQLTDAPRSSPRRPAVPTGLNVVLSERA